MGPPLVIETTALAGFIPKVYNPLMCNRGFWNFYGVAAFPADECFHVEVVEKGRVY